MHQENGDLNDIYYRPAQGINGRTIATYTDVQAMDAFWSKANQYMHIVYADSSNRVWDMRLRPNQSPIVFGPIFSAPAAVYDIGAYDGPDSFMHAHALLSNGDVWEIYFNTTNAYSDLIQNFGGGWTSIASMSCTDHPPPGYVTFCNPNDYNEFYPANGPYIDSYWYGNGSHYMNILDPPWQPSPAAISVAAVLNYGLANVNSGYKALFVAADDNTVYELSFAAGVDAVATVPTKSTVWSYN